MGTRSGHTRFHTLVAHEKQTKTPSNPGDGLIFWKVEECTGEIPPLGRAGHLVLSNLSRDSTLTSPPRPQEKVGIIPAECPVVEEFSRGQPTENSSCTHTLCPHPALLSCGAPASPMLLAEHSAVLPFLPDPKNCSTPRARAPVTVSGTVSGSKARLQKVRAEWK